MVITHIAGGATISLPPAQHVNSPSMWLLAIMHAEMPLMQHWWHYGVLIDSPHGFPLSGVLSVFSDPLAIHSCVWCLPAATHFTKTETTGCA